MGLTIEKCLQAWTNSLGQMGIKADIVFYGDSLTYHGDFSSVFPDKMVCNLGLRGDTIQGMIKRIEQVSILAPDKVYVMAGINDVACCTIGKFGEIYEQLLIEIIKAVPNSEVIVQSILPVNDKVFPISCNNAQIIQCNKEITRLATKYGKQLIDLFLIYTENGQLPRYLTIDGLHLQKEAYGRWYRTLRNNNVV